MAKWWMEENVLEFRLWTITWSVLLATRNQFNKTLVVARAMVWARLTLSNCISVRTWVRYKEFRGTCVECRNGVRRLVKGGVKANKCMNKPNQPCRQANANRSWMLKFGHRHAFVQCQILATCSLSRSNCNLGIVLWNQSIMERNVRRTKLN